MTNVTKNEDDRAFHMDVGARIKMLRELKGITAAALARAVGTTRQSVYIWERGDGGVTARNLVRLADALDTTIDMIIPARDHAQVQGRLVRAVDIEAVLPDECWVFKFKPEVTTNFLSCTGLIGGTFGNGATWTEEMCCLPCRIRLVVDRAEVL